ncbi:MAG: hypothetical protein GY807_05620 [Gammaproteobacteria bacterium]|nr:hypothetical protein [Gammaproteobacteria bacterium]
MFEWKKIVTAIVVGGILICVTVSIYVWQEMMTLNNKVSELDREIENIRLKGDLKGKQGDPGSIGPQGPRGEPGPIGPPGSKGESYPVAEFTKLKSEVFKVRESKEGIQVDIQGGMHWGRWRGGSYCPDNHYVCGINQRVEGQQGNGDDTAVNDLQIYCCRF